jgi:hypothetical protein
MNQILAKRYAFCNFSSIIGFPNQVPNRNEWENSIPIFRGEEWEVPAEHLLDFHEFIDRLEIVHEDVQIKLFKCSLEGIALDWCQSLPSASVSSLADFHAAFHAFCEDQFPADLLYPQCCHEFHLLTKDSDVHEKYVVEENVFHHDQEDPITPFENLKNHDQIDKLESETVETKEDHEGSLQFLDLQKKEILSRYEEEGEDLKGPDQQSVLYASPTDLEQPAFNNELIKDSFQHLFNLQLDQQFNEVLLCDFDDPIAVYLDFMSSINPRIFLLEGDCLYPLFKHLFCMIWFPLFFGSRSSMMALKKFLTWLHWKHHFI